MVAAFRPERRTSNQLNTMEITIIAASSIETTSGSLRSRDQEGGFAPGTDSGHIPESDKGING
jgi:hypothetical protein